MEKHAEPCPAAVPSGSPLDESISLRSPVGIEVGKDGVRRTASAALLAGGNELQILHNGDVYRLTLTRSGKPILHK